MSETNYIFLHIRFISLLNIFGNNSFICVWALREYAVWSLSMTRVTIWKVCMQKNSKLVLTAFISCLSSTMKLLYVTMNF